MVSGVLISDSFLVESTENAVTMSISTRAHALAWFLWFSFRVMILFCCNFGAWLLGLQPGPASSNAHLTHSAHLTHLTLSESRARMKASRRRHKRGRPPVRCLKHKLLKRSRRHFLALLAQKLRRKLQPLAQEAGLTFVLRALHAALAFFWSSGRTHGPAVPEARRLSPPVLPVTQVRCTSHQLFLEDSGFVELPQQNMLDHVQVCLETWCSALAIPESRLAGWVLALEAARPCNAVRKLPSQMTSAVLRLAASVACLLESKVTSWQHVQSLSVILQALCLWIFPPSHKCKRSTSLGTDFMFFACCSLKLALITDWQSRSGRRKRQRAVKRWSLPPAVFDAFLNPLGWTTVSKNALTEFLSAQIFAVLREEPGHAVMYQLSSPYINYVGSTSMDVKRSGCSGSSPTMRAFQHILEHKQQRTFDNKQPTSAKLKCRLFRNVRVCDHMFWVLAQGPETYIRCLEEAGIACWRPHGNSKSIGNMYVRRARRSRASRECRARPAHRVPPWNEARAHTISYEAWHCLCSKMQTAHSSMLQQQPWRCHLAGIPRVGFSTGYSLALQYQLRVGFGPIDLADVNMPALLARYIADARKVDWDSLHQRFGALRNAHSRSSASRAVRMANIVRSMPRSVAKKRAQARMSAHLRDLGLAPIKRVCVGWPAGIPVWTFRQTLRCMRQQAAAAGDTHAAWFVSQVQAVRERRRTLADRWQFISVAQRFGKSSGTCKLARLKPTAQDCASMRRVKLHWRVPEWQSRSDILSVAQRSLQWIAGKMRLPLPLSMCRRLLASTVHVPDPSPSYQQYLSKFPRCLSHEVLVQEDKDKNAAWIMPICVYEKWCFWLFRQDAVHWVPVSADVRAVCEEYRQLHLELLPKHLKCWASWKRWEHFGLPYAYCTLKAKCFAADGLTQHICQKPAHSCFRRIISWRAHPARNVYRGAGRAILGVIAALSVGFETANLSTAVGDFRKAVNRLACSSRRCFRCFSPKPVLSLCVCDAAQMYEELCPTEIRDAVGSLIDKLRASVPAATGIAVARSKRLRTWLTTSDFKRNASCSIWTWSDILAVLDLDLRQPIIRLGNALFQQQIGAPIGGHLSKAIASAALAFAELKACQSLDKLKQAGFIPLGAGSFCDFVAPARYVDDLALGSHILCSTCLHTLTKHIYPKPICFDSAAPDKFGLQWLDVWLESVEGYLRVRADGVEHAWRSSGGAGLPQKFRLKVWLGDSHVDIHEMRGIVASKLVRLKSLQLCPQQLRKTVSAEIGLWALSGYPAATIKRIWRRSRHFPEASQIAAEIVNAWMQSDLPQRILPSWFE